jgi:S-adenosylmethionine synthetase
LEELNLFTSESVSEGHPDKVCDQISDAILDACLAQDPNSRVACETFATTETIIVGGEISTKAVLDYEKIVRDTLRNIGYVHKDLGIGADSCRVEILIDPQSSEISDSVEKEDSDQIGAGDQGIMFGYACKETEGLMPYPIVIAHNLVREASKQRKANLFEKARPDMKSQVTIDYTDPKHPKVHTVVMSIQHDPFNNEQEQKQFMDYVKVNIIEKVLKEYEQHNIDSSEYKVILNPSGSFILGGPHGDTGLTGRKIIVDTYGGYSRHGGGAFSGKDATKVDRSAAYAARWVAKNVVAAGMADHCEIQLSYAIGVAEPISIRTDTYGESIDKEIIAQAIRNEFDLTPFGIIKELDLKRPIYLETATYGHMGRKHFPWEQTNKVEALKKYL